MLDACGSVLGTTKRMYTSVLDFAIIPFIYSGWYDVSLFEHINQFHIIYFSLCGAGFVLKETSARYKEFNPKIEPADYNIAVKLIDSMFATTWGTAEIVFPAIIIDFMFPTTRKLWSPEVVQLIRSGCVSVGVINGLASGLASLGIFKKVPTTLPEVIELVSVKVPNPEMI